MTTAQERCWQSFHAGGTGAALVRRIWDSSREIATIRECLLKPNHDPQVRDQYFALPIDGKKFTTDSGDTVMVRFSTDLDRIRDVRWDVAASGWVLLPENTPVTAKLLCKFSHLSTFLFYFYFWAAMLTPI